MTIGAKVRNIALAAGLVLIPTAAMATDQVHLESKLGVANVSQGDSVYSGNVAAKSDQVVEAQIWYHNTENADSGKVANNLKVAYQLPTQAGKTQKITGIVSADNSNTVTNTVGVNLELAQSRLEYIPGTAVWRHNTGTNEAANWVNTTLNSAQEQQLLNGGVVLENEKPCFNFEGTVTVKMRVKTDVISITKQVRVAGTKDWTTENAAKTGDTLEYQIRWKNEGNTTLKDVVIGDNMPGNVTYVKGSTKLMNSSFPNGTEIKNDNVVNGGINVGTYEPGAVGYLMFQAKISSDLKPGDYDLKNVALVKANGQVIENYAHTKVHVEGKVTPTITPTPTTSTPVTPANPLPDTGAEEAAAGVLGTGALTYAGYFYRKSRKSLVSALRNVIK